MIYHGINYIPNPSNTLLNIAQDLAIQSLNRFTSNDVQFISLQFENEEPAIGADIVINLKKNSSKITERKLPFLLEIFNGIADQAIQDEDWIGFTNSDIVLKSEEFYSTLRNSDKKAILFNRVEIKDIDLTRDLDQFLNYRGEPNPYDGRDGFFLRKEIWDKIRSKLPDYIIAEPYWDIGLIELLKEYEPLIVPNQIYHYFHPRRWARNTPGALYNQNLFDQQKSNLVNN
ncbi:hypothetical protein DOJK_00668 [Patescibacteria group bacterium]|nr:hypothetical protein DOJK_00668 [Patescibacteria group bacterium]